MPLLTYYFWRMGGGMSEWEWVVLRNTLTDTKRRSKQLCSVINTCELAHEDDLISYQGSIW